MQGCALVFARISSLVLLRKTLGRALDCFLLGSLGFPFLRMHAKTNFFQKVKNKKKICLLKSKNLKA